MDRQGDQLTCFGSDAAKDRVNGECESHPIAIDHSNRVSPVTSAVRVGRPFYDFVLGMNPWGFRVAAHASLMTDTYPPFRLDMGGAEPPTGTADGSILPTLAPVTA